MRSPVYRIPLLGGNCAGSPINTTQRVILAASSPPSPAARTTADTAAGMLCRSRLVHDDDMVAKVTDGVPRRGGGSSHHNRSTLSDLRMQSPHRLLDGRIRLHEFIPCRLCVTDAGWVIRAGSSQALEQGLMGCRCRLLSPDHVGVDAR
ncbi:hypothetical protein I4F81_001776 [Pyropia yezoensis]|uniref:Uncharacterized protein n=1 Tax=Pyropia yezoensis TaxID=2788 RepID=A0ACC3BN68_PYRYE|nr:hypothetical protein I4F81_001776 [Neopyropia yezoensis]